MRLEGVPISHIVDTPARFQGVALLRSKYVEEIWVAYFECWCTLYQEYRERMCVAVESTIASNRCGAHTRDCGIAQVFSGIESHNSLEVGEFYHLLFAMYYLWYA